MQTFINSFARPKVQTIVLFWVMVASLAFSNAMAQVHQEIAALDSKIKNRQQLTNLPTVYLTVPDAIGKNIDDVLYKKGKVAEYHKATIQVVDESAPNTPNRIGSFTETSLEIKVRGNSTANDGKKPYRLKFGKDEKDAAGNVLVSHKHDMIGQGYSKRNWTLLTNHKDASLIHNALTYYVGQAVGMPFCPGYKFVDLVINDEFRGNYMLSDHCEVGSHRIEVDENTGWFIESARSDMIEDPSVNAGGLFMTIKNPDTDNYTTDQTDALKKEVSDYFTRINYYMGVWSTPCSDKEFRDPVNGWRKYFDEESLVNFYIGINLTGDYDGFMTVKMYRETNGKMQFGPLWDKDLAYGNWSSDDGTKLCENQQANSNTFCDYMQRIMTDPVFIKNVHDRYHEILDAGYLEKIKENIDMLATLVTQSQALNYKKWWTGANYPAEITKLKAYIDIRVDNLTKTWDKMYEDAGGKNIKEPEPESEIIPETSTFTYDNASNNSFSVPATAFDPNASSIEVTFARSTTESMWGFYGFNGSEWNAKTFQSTTAQTVTIKITDKAEIEAVSKNGIRFQIQSNGSIGNLTVTVRNIGVTAPTPDPNAHCQLTNLPTIYLKADVIGSSWAAASIECYDSMNKLTQGTEWTNELLEVQYQGSGKEISKNSYRIKFGTETKLLASGAYKQWVLLANDDDPSLMRNALAKKIGDQLGLPFTPGYQFVDLYVNDVYMGTYQITDRVKAEEGRALVQNGKKKKDWHVRFNSESEIEEDGLTADEYVAGSRYMPNVIAKNPDPDDLTTAETATLLSTMKSYFEQVFAVDNEGHYTQLADNVDQQQLIAWYVAQEILCIYKGFDSVEAYRSVTSTAADQKLHMAILWDSEKSLGNSSKHPVEMTDLETPYSYESLMIRHADYKMMKRMFRDLWQQPWFAEGVLALWTSKRASLLSDLTSLTSSLQQELSLSQAKDAALWPSNDDQGGTYDDKVASIRTYLNKRFEYLNVKFLALARPGDLNNDGKVDKLDVPLLASILLDKSTDTYGRGDVNGDGKLSIEDLTTLIEKVK